MNEATIATDTAYSIAQQTARQTNTPLPDALTKDMDALTAEVDAIGSATRPDSADFADALRAAVSEGRDPVTDDAVRRHLALHQLKAYLPPIIDEYRDTTRAALLKKHTPAIIRGWATTVDAAQKTLAAARAVLPDDCDVMDPKAVTGLQPALMTTWGEAHAAVNTVEKISDAWGLLVVATRLAIVHPNMRALIVADLTADELDALGRNPSAADAARAGHALDLATPEAYTERCRVVTEQRQRAASLAAADQDHYARNGAPTLTRLSRF